MAILRDADTMVTVTEASLRILPAVTVEFSITGQGETVLRGYDYQEGFLMRLQRECSQPESIR